MRLFHILCILTIMANLISNGNCFPSAFLRVFMYRWDIRDLFTKTVNDGYCIKLYNSKFGVKLWKILFCPTFVIKNEFNLKQLQVTDTDYFYNNLDYNGLGLYALEYPADLVKLRKNCVDNLDIINKSDSVLIEANNCPPEN